MSRPRSLGIGGIERRAALKEGAYLAKILNAVVPGYPEDPERERMISLLSELQSLAKNPKGLDDQTPEDFANVNAVLRSYPWVVELIKVGADGPVFADFPAANSSLSLDMRMVVKLARLRLLGGLRRCDRGTCGTWFFAPRNPKARWCSDACRLAEYRARPGYKEKNRKLQKDHYERIKARLERLRQIEEKEKSNRKRGK